MTKAYNDFIGLVKDINNLRAIEDLLQWDQETFMPQDGVKDRSLQLATLSTTTHEKLTSTRMEQLLNELQKESVQESLSAEQRTNVREISWEFHRASAVPPELVNEIAKSRSLASKEWIEARSKSDFSLFSPHLSILVDLKKRVAEAIGYEDKPYDALLDEFEPGLKTRQVVDLFSRLRDELIPIVTKILNSGIKPDISFIQQEYPVDAQIMFNHEMAKDLGFDFNRGRIDESAHPFTMGTIHDTRFTTRYSPDNMRFAMFATIHETGHALYALGHKEEHYGTPMGQPVSMGTHESQSRMYENIVGRGISFWRYFFPRIQQAFPAQLGSTTMEEFHAAINEVKPSLIRVEADEVTYNLHILLRFEMENGLFNGTLDIQDIPQIWSEKMERFLGIQVPNDAQGALQDVHWSLGYFGYFPTYTLGNLYSAQLYAQAMEDIKDIENHIENGEFNVLLDWLRSNIHEKGRLHRSDDLLKEVTGKSLDESIFINYLRSKFSKLYGFS